MPRKKTPPAEPKSNVIVGAHVTPQERETIRVAAALQGKPLSRWLRDTALKEATAVLGNRGVDMKTGEPET